MGLIATAGKYCYVQCDRRNCTRKMEHVDVKLLQELAGLCGWENSGTQWTCPDCARQTATKPERKASRQRRRTELKA
jgi:hypothetical protein